MTDKKNISELVIKPDVPNIALRAVEKSNDKKAFTYTIDAKAKNSTELMPEGSILKKAKTITHDGEETVRQVVKDAKSTITKDEISSVVDKSKISLTKDSLTITFGGSSIKLSSSGIDIKSDGAITLDGKSISLESKGAANIKASGAVSMKGASIKGSAGTVSFQ